jgi:hypothetical protein
MVNLPGRARNVLARRQRRAHVVVGEHVARAHDHCGESLAGERPCKNWSELKRSLKRNGFPLDRHSALAICLSMILSEDRYHPDQVRGRLFRDHALVQARRGCKEKIVFCKRSNLSALFARKLTSIAPPRDLIFTSPRWGEVERSEGEGGLSFSFGSVPPHPNPLPTGEREMKAAAIEQHQASANCRVVA